MKNTKGFTLIELIVVIAILGVLALILVPNFMGYLDDAKKTTASSNASNAYIIATSAAAKGATEVSGSYTLKQVSDKVRDDYPNAVVTCNGLTAEATACTEVTSVKVTSSGYDATATKGKVDVVPAAK